MSLGTIIYVILGMRHLSLILTSNTLLENTLISIMKWKIIPQRSSSAMQKMLDDLLSKREKKQPINQPTNKNTTKTGT